MLGTSIKRLREKRGLSQSELADVLSVTAQAVSKWESDQTNPDIEALPRLASYFGVTIDDLFDYDKDLEYQRIDTTLFQNDNISFETFIKYADFLKADIDKDPKDHRALSTLADLYHFMACRINDKASDLAYRALLLCPDDQRDLNTLNNANNGHIEDFNISCHSKLIDMLYSLSDGNKETRRKLIENLISDHRLDEAMALLDKVDYKTYYELWIKESKEGYGAVKEAYESFESDDWYEVFGIANLLAKNHEYEKAIEKYLKAHELTPKPRYTDMLASCAYISLLMDDKRRAKEFFKEELKLLKDEWHMTKGQLVQELKDKIATL